MEERLKILTMLEEGKINVEEAATLLEALEPQSKKGRESPLSGVVSDAMDSVSSVLATIPPIVKAGLSVGVGKKSVEASPKERVVIKSVGGNLALNLSKDRILGEVETGVVRSSGSERELVLKAVGGDARFSVPRVKELRISSLGGDITGEIAARALSVSLMGGDVELSLRDLEDGVVKTTSGDIELAIAEDSNLFLDIQANSGDVICELPLSKKESGENFLRGSLKEPKGKLQVRTLAGDVRIRKRPGKA